jgi:hypothetical protein
MKRATFLLLAAAAILGLSAIDANAKKPSQPTWRYEIEYVKTGGNNSVLVKVWGYAKKPAAAIEQAKKDAVHGVIFKGYTATGGGAISQRPLAKDPAIATQYADFFTDFFSDGGQYLRYVSAVDGNTEIRKIKGGDLKYKAGVVVTVSKDLLRSDLETAGIIKGLSAGF